MNSNYSKSEQRILSVIDSLIESRSELKTPIDSLLNHIHSLGIIGDEKVEDIRAVVVKVLDEYGEKIVHIKGAYSDVITLGSILRKIFSSKSRSD